MLNFLKNNWWEILKGITAVVTIAMVYFGFPEKTKQLITQVEETHAYVKNLSDELKDNIEDGQTVMVGVSSEAYDNQAILLSNCQLTFKYGESIILRNPASNFQPRIKLLISNIVDPKTPAECGGKIQLYINKKAAAMLDFNSKDGTKKLKIMKLEEK
ncbi:MAG: hypothetical protein V2A75_08165 [Pseudomonadota bacterium]